MSTISTRLIERCEKATAAYKQASADKNHLLICIWCWQWDVLVIDKERDWCSLVIVCPKCHSFCCRALGSKLSDKTNNWLLDTILPTETRAKLVYSDTIVRSMEGAVQNFFKDIEGYKTAWLSGFNGHLQRLLGFKPPDEMGIRIWRFVWAPQQWREMVKGHFDYRVDRLDIDGPPELTGQDAAVNFCEHMKMVLYTEPGKRPF